MFVSGTHNIHGNPEKSCSKRSSTFSGERKNLLFALPCRSLKGGKKWYSGSYGGGLIYGEDAKRRHIPILKRHVLYVPTYNTERYVMHAIFHWHADAMLYSTACSKLCQAGWTIKTIYNFDLRP